MVVTLRAVAIAAAIYDPRVLNDRLLLGLEGSMAEFELGLLRQRAREAFEQKVKRGFALWEVSVGFVRSEDGRIETNNGSSLHKILGSCVGKSPMFRSGQVLRRFAG